MTRIQFPFVCDERHPIDVELVECQESEFFEFLAQFADTSEWSVCPPENGSTSRLVRAVRLIGPDAPRSSAPVLRLVGT